MYVGKGNTPGATALTGWGDENIHTYTTFYVHFPIYKKRRQLFALPFPCSERSLFMFNNFIVDRVLSFYLQEANRKKGIEKRKKRAASCPCMPC